MSPSPSLLSYLICFTKSDYMQIHLNSPITNIVAMCTLHAVDIERCYIVRTLESVFIDITINIE